MKDLPILTITDYGAIISDNNGDVTFAYRLRLPILFSISPSQFELLVESFRKFAENLGEDIIIHKQDYYFAQMYSIFKDEHKNDDIVDVDENIRFFREAYQRHFGNRPYLNLESYLYITKHNSDSNHKSIISKKFSDFDILGFKDKIEISSQVLHKAGVFLTELSKEELLSPKSPINKFINMSDTKDYELKDIDFKNNKIHVGNREIKLYAIYNLSQFPAKGVKYHSYSNSLAVSNLFNFSFDLGIPHVTNQIIYLPKKGEIESSLLKKREKLVSYNVKSSNDAAIEDINELIAKNSTLNTQLCYYHFNIFCFGEESKEIEKQSAIAFAESDFKMSEPSLSRKDLFYAGIAGNSTQILKIKNEIMCKMTDLEAFCYGLYEQGLSDEQLEFNGKGIKLCDRKYGIPFNVDIFDEPLKKGKITNRNFIVLAKAGSGKSFFVNHLIISEIMQDSHFFCIDASYSYQTNNKKAGGVYLTFDERNVISFNPFYSLFLKDDIIKDYFLNKEKYNSINENDESKLDIIKYKDWIEQKINLLVSLISIITKGNNKNTNSNEEKFHFDQILNRQIVENYMKDRCINNKVDDMKFDDFFSFVEEFLPKFLNERNLDEKEDFHIQKYKLLLEPYRSGNNLGYLLNSEDDKIKNLSKQKFVVIDISRIKGNSSIFPIVSLMSIDLYNTKVRELPRDTKKFLIFDEAWQAIGTPVMAEFIQSMVKVIRKYGGITGLISQELNDFITNEIIKESIVANSDVKIFLEMSDKKNDFERIKNVLGLTDNSVKLILSLNQNTDIKRKYKEVCIVTGSEAQAYAVEVPSEFKGLYETNPKDVVKMEEFILKANGNINLALRNYQEYSEN